MHIIISETSKKYNQSLHFTDKKCGDMQIFWVVSDGPEYTLRKYVIANTFSYTMQTRFHSFEMSIQNSTRMGCIANTAITAIYYFFSTALRLNYGCYSIL